MARGDRLVGVLEGALGHAVVERKGLGRMRDVKFLVAHHTESRLMTTPQEVNAWHRDERGWLHRVNLADYGDDPVPTWLQFDGHGETEISIGYHGIIQGDGTFCPGRPFERVGAHAGGANMHTVGLAFCGDFHKPVSAGGDLRPTDAQVETFVAWAVILALRYPKFGVSPAGSIFGHRDMVALYPEATRTVCPGDRLYALLPELRRLVTEAMPSNDKE